MLNLALLRHWENWATILLMVLIAFFAVNSLSKLVVSNKERNK